MAGQALLGSAIVFSFISLVLVCLGFATDYWQEITVNRENLRSISAAIGADFETDPNYFGRHRGIFKVCYRGTETVFLDNNDDLVSGNCLWIEGLSFNSDQSTTNFEDEYEIRNHLIRAQLVSLRAPRGTPGATIAEAFVHQSMTPNMLATPPVRSSPLYVFGIPDLPAKFLAAKLFFYTPFF